MQAEIRGYFETEARELIDRLTQGVAGLRPDVPVTETGQAAALQSVLRAAHTLKGAAHVVGERALAAQAHTFEDAVAAWRTAQTPEGLAGLTAMVDELARMVSGPAAESVPAPVPAASPKQVPVSPRQTVERKPSGSPKAMRTVRVDAVKAGLLLDAVAESAELVAAMRGVLDHLGEVEGRTNAEMRRMERNELRRRLDDQLDRLGRQMRRMQADALQLRLGSAETLLLEAGRIVRATAAAVGRPAVCVTQGEQERIDVRSADALAEALLHLIRNALAHGIEPAAERQAAGKPAVATITISVEQERGWLLVRCSDDGRGIAIEPLRRRAEELGLTSPQKAGEPGFFDLLLLLSAASQPDAAGARPATEISGRGVGLDAVRAAMADVRGNVSVESIPGTGTTFSLRVPQRHTAVEVLEVEAGGQRYALPMSAVGHTFRLERHLIQQAQGSRTLLVEQETMPFFQLQDGFPVAAHPAAAGLIAGAATGIVLTQGNRRLALAVDSVLGKSSLLVQPSPSAAGVDRVVAGAALGGGGVPYLVLDPAGLMALAETGVAPRAQAAVAVARRPILVIDDSLTTRMLEQSILEAEGYEVELATSAEQGLRMAQAKDYALFLVDVEMPGMNGFEFVQATRADARLRNVPAIMVTSLDSAESRERGRAAGAVSYVVKGEFNQQVYLDRIRGIAGGAA